MLLKHPESLSEYLRSLYSISALTVPRSAGIPLYALCDPRARDLNTLNIRVANPHFQGLFHCTYWEQGTL